jgi:hypothetical protein
VWLEEVPLRVCYPELYEICSDPEALVCDMVVNGEWRVLFRRRWIGYLHTC